MAKEKFPHYWLCDDCATARGGIWPKGHVCTVTQGDCKYCGMKNAILIPWVDYNWPRDKQADLKAKVTRD